MNLAPYASGIAVWVAATSLVSFVLAGWDKSRAKAGRSRVPERTLLGSALIGGTLGLLAGMILFRHKTRKIAFLAPFGLVVLVQAAAVWWLVTRA